MCNYNVIFPSKFIIQNLSIPHSLSVESMAYERRDWFEGVKDAAPVSHY